MASGGDPDPTAKLEAELVQMRTLLQSQSDVIAALSAGARNNIPTAPFKPDLPPPLSILHGNPGAEDQFRYWKRALTLALKPISDEGGSPADIEKKKFPFLFRSLSPVVHSSIEEASESENYATCMAALETLYVKAPSDVLARDALYKRRQQVGEDIDALWNDLQSLSRKCGFRAFTTAEENRADNVRVMFVLALRSPEIRYQILQGKGEEKTLLTGEEALALARSLDRAREESEKNQTSTYSFALRDEPYIPEPLEVENLTFTNQKSKSKKKPVRLIETCKWCGKTHALDRNDCPANDATCTKCREKGHFQKMCPKKD